MATHSGTLARQMSPAGYSPGVAKNRTQLSNFTLWFKCASACLFSHVQLCVIPWTVACQAPLSVGFSRQKHCSGLSFPSPDLPNPGIEPTSLLSPALAKGFFTTVPPGKPIQVTRCKLLLLLFSHQVMSDSLRPHGLQHTRLPCPSPSPAQTHVH